MDPYVGEVRCFAFPKAPNGWVFCNGQSLSASEYQMLYALIGNTYGGNGTSFNVPNLNGTVPIGLGTGTGLTPRTLAQTGGTETVTLSAAQVPAHTHAQQATTATNTTQTAGPTVNFGGDPTNTVKHFVSPIPSSPQWLALAANSVQASGGGQAHPNVMPSVGLNYCICYQGIWPQQP